MTLFANLKISTKLSLLIGSMLVALAAVGGYAVHSLMQAKAANAASIKVGSELLNAVDLARGAEVSFKIQIQEFKNILLRGHMQQDFDSYLAAFRKRSEVIGREFDELGTAMTGLGVPTGSLDEARQMHAGIIREYLQALQQFDVAKAESSQVVDRAVRGKDRPLEQKIEAVVSTLQKFSEVEGARLAQRADAESDRAIAVMALVLLLAVLTAVAIGVVLTRGIVGPIRVAVGASQRVAAGDLTVHVQAGGTDETGQLLHAISQMTQNLRVLVGEVAGGARTVADTSAQIAQGNVDLSQRTEEQASTLEETASSMEELTSTVTQNASNARQASALAVGASEVARRGGAVVGQVVSTMTGISAASRRISDIIGVIDGIAFQTNILALNAAVEAARAGEQGRGFAVVAAEVRNLAQRSAAAAKEIKGLIGSSVDQVEAGTRLVDAAGQTMEEIVASVNKVSDLIADIAAASQQQSSGIEQVNTAVVQMDQVVQQNASLVEEAAAATESMKEQAAALLATVAQFNLGDTAPVKSTVTGSDGGRPAWDGRAGVRIAPIRVRPAVTHSHAARAGVATLPATTTQNRAPNPF